MRLSVVVFASILLAVSLVPEASAAPRNVALTGDANVGALSGTLKLGTVGTGPNVNLPVNVPVLWVDPAALTVPSTLHDMSLPFSVYLTSARGNLTVTYGAYNQTTGFRAFASIKTLVAHEARNVGPLPHVRTGAQLVDIGNASATMQGINGAFAKGESPALRLVSDVTNVVYTQPSLLGSSQQSTATVPLPELPAALLMGAGLVLVLGVVRFRK